MQFKSIIASIKKLRANEVEKGTIKGHWFRFSGDGEVPSPRLGHSCTWIPHSDDDNCKLAYGCIYCIGGANPEQSFEDTCLLDLNKSLWSNCKVQGLIPRYEHAAFATHAPDLKIYIFGGSNEHGNLNDIQQYNVTTKSWKDILLRNTSKLPSPRTHHTTAIVNSKSFVLL